MSIPVFLFGPLKGSYQDPAPLYEETAKMSGSVNRLVSM